MSKKKPSQETYEACKKYAQVKRFRAKPARGYFKDDGEFVSLRGYYATLAGETVFFDEEGHGLLICKEHPCYYDWESAKKAAYLFRDKCIELVKRYEDMERADNER